MNSLKKAPARSLFCICCLLFLAVVNASLAAQVQPPAHAIASAHPLATQAGREILQAGGNAFDAAVTVSAVLAVVGPYSSGLGGGGFWLLHRARDGHDVMLDGRERAPLAAHRDLYLNRDGRVIEGLSVNGPLAAGIPGEPAALVHLAENYGRLPLSKTLAPAIHLARHGFPVDEPYRRMTQWRLEQLRQSKAAAAQFLLRNEVPPVGYLILQPDLAATLSQLAERGHTGFYAGPVAEKLVEGVRQAGGIWQLKDLKEYRVVERQPIKFDYGPYRLTSASPPSSGGIVLAIMLNILESMEFGQQDSSTSKHFVIEAMRRAYRERARYLGDPDFVAIPQQRLLSPYYAAGLARDISPERASPSLPHRPDVPAEGRDTTHFSILDREGNRVAATLSINYPFGAAFVAPGTGVLLNDEMDDFSSHPGVPNVYGLVGGEANAIEAGKRMLSSMTPTFVESGEKIAILGTPGGSRIITMLLHGILSLTKGDEVRAWVAGPRFHHQYLPDVVQYEPGALTDVEIKQLNLKGHQLEELSGPYGNMQAILWNKNKSEVTAASDPRGIGSAEVWH